MFPISHIAFPLLLVSIFDKIRKANNKQGLPLYYFLIAGFAGILPDLLNIHIWASERVSFSHSIFLPLLFLTAYLAIRKQQYRDYAILMFVGAFSHLILDMLVAPLWPLYPLGMFELNHFVVFPAHGITLDGIVYANFIEHATWYAFDALFFILFIISEKTRIVENIYLKIKNKD